MLITLKPLKGEQFQVEIDESEKISDLKKKVAEAKADFPVEVQKLIYQGKILQDDATIKDSGVTSEGFIVCMATKAAAAAPAPATTPAAATPAPAATPVPASPPAATVPAAPVAAAPAANLPSIITDLRQNPRWRQLAQRVTADPQSLPRMLAALRPRHAPLLEALTQNLPGFVQMCREEVGGTAAMPGMPGGMPGPNNPQFRQIAAALAQNPQMLQQMAQNDPELAAALQQNPQAVAAALQMAAAGGLPGGMPGMPGGMEMPQIELSEEEKAAVERLCALGYDRAMVIEVYVGCGKDEQLAANILMDEGMGQ